MRVSNGLGKPQSQARRRRPTMHEAQSSNPCTLPSPADAGMRRAPPGVGAAASYSSRSLGYLRLEIPLCGVSLTFVKALRGSRRRPRARSSISGAHARPEPTCKPVPRQSQAIAHGPHTHGGKRAQVAPGPARTSERQRRYPGREVLVATDERRSSPARANQRGQVTAERSRVRPHRSFSIPVASSRREPPNNRRLPADFEQAPCTRLEADTRAVAHSRFRDLLEKLAFAALIAVPHREPRLQSEPS